MMPQKVVHLEKMGRADRHSARLPRPTRYKDVADP